MMYEEIKKILLNIPDHQRSESQRFLIMKLLKKIPFFQNQEPIFLKECQKQLQFEKAPPNHIIFKTGARGDKLYIILSGEVGIYKQVSQTERVIDQQNQSKISRTSLKISTIFRLPGAFKKRSSQFDSPFKNTLLKRSSNVETILSSTPTTPSSRIIGQKFEQRKTTLSRINYTDIDEQISFFNTHEKIAQCSAGQCFGELAVIQNKPRIATVRTGKNEVIFATLDKASYDDIFLNCTTELDQKLKAMQNFFPDVARNLLVRISYNFVRKIFQYQEVIYHINDKPDYIYFNVEGQVKLELKNTQKNSNQSLLRPQSKPMKAKIVSILQANSFFGLEEIVEQTPRKLTAVVISEYCTTFALSMQHFQELLKSETTQVFVDYFKKNAELKNSFYEEQISKDIGDIRKLNFESEEQPRIMQPSKSIRKMIEEENQLKNLFKKLNEDEKKKVEKNMESKLEVQNGVQKKNIQSWKLDDIQKKKHLMNYYLNVQRISKNQEVQTTYFQYQRKIYENSITKKVKDKSKVILDCSNPLFYQPKEKKKIEDVNYLERDLSSAQSTSRMKKKILQMSNKDESILESASLFYYGRNDKKSTLFKTIYK